MIKFIWTKNYFASGHALVIEANGVFELRKATTFLDFGLKSRVVHQVGNFSDHWKDVEHSFLLDVLV